MKKKNGIVFLQTRIAQELKQLRKVVKRVEEKLARLSSSQPDDFTIGGFANYVHNFYNGAENIFKLIAEYVDESRPKSAGWHRELLNQMSLELQGVRPAVLTVELVSVLEDYLEFRHFFRHSYGFDLDWDELKPKAENLKPTFEKLETAFQQFFAFLQAAGEQIE
jgi:hypothetical protein